MDEGAPGVVPKDLLIDNSLYQGVLRSSKDTGPSINGALHKAQASSAAFLAQVPIQDICRVVTWSSVHTFLLHYVIIQQARDDAAFGRAVLQSATR